MKSHNIKEILEERTIEVPENSWEKLAAQLDANDRKERRTRLYPYAACLALLAGFIIFMITKKEALIGDETIVETEAKSNITEDSKEKMIPQKAKNEVLEKEVVRVEEIVPIKDKNSVVSNKAISKQKIVLRDEMQKEIQNAIVIHEKDLVPTKLETVIATKDIVIESNEELRASIAALSSEEKITITDAEIDQLLKEAKQSLSELDAKKEVITSFATADELLQEVELELDRSFKQKVFELIKHKIQETRTVLADN